MAVNVFWLCLGLFIGVIIGGLVSLLGFRSALATFSHPK